MPDVAYLAELLPGKKPSTFTISSFRQINGEYMDDNEFIAENIFKLFKKIDPEEYQLILPDFLFTNTIVSVKEKSDAKIKEYLTEKLLPELGISVDSHQTDTTVLTQYGDITKIQLSALEKSLIEPLQISAEQTKIKIKSISPLSWSIKSLVSLEPSISVIQIDSMLYVALHYIGVDQANQAKVDEVENIYETIKTLKGAEPSIQTIYLLSNELVEEKLKEHLSDTLPIQQLASKQNEDNKMPSYVQKTIEAGMRTLSISDYPVPQFELGKAPEGATIDVSEDEIKDESESDLPKPQKTEPIKEKRPEKPEDTSKDGEQEEIALENKETSPPTKPTRPDLTPEKTSKEYEDEDDEIEALLESLKTDGENDDGKTVETETKSQPDKNRERPMEKASPTTPEVPKKVIKNKDQTKIMLKMVFVTLAVFFATVGIGIGIGLGVLQLTQSYVPEESIPPVIETTLSPSPSPSTSPSPSPTTEVNKAELSILVVNATTKAGYAGETADKLTADKFGTVKASNAKGDYTPGTYVLLNEENQTLITVLEKTTDLKLSYRSSKETEDPKNEHDAVIVLAK
ncbi:LytR C-terminal domain-containing protein [Patescibacteria group bacterium]|nr:LytR C-terminal domain-containing protein [Patescibacteria group bacterium]